MEEYKKRIADQLLADQLDAMGAVLIEGAKYCGKTTLAARQAGSVLYMADPQTRDENVAMAQLSISRLLEGATPRLIDEWQIVPELWDAVRAEVDKRNADGQFMLTGSAVPADSSRIFHSGTGRFARLTLRTMSLWESGESNGSVSLAALFRNAQEIEGLNPLDLEELAYLICRGGWPRATLKTNRKAALIQARQYYKAVVEYDVSRADNVERNPELVMRLMRSYARHQGSQATLSTLLADLKGNEVSTLSEGTIYAYINALKRIFVIEDALAWTPNLRSKTAIRTADTRYFADPSIATAALGLEPEDLPRDLNTFGLLFETLCIRDLRVYLQAAGGTVYHYRDKNGLECDAVLHMPNGTYGLAEIKLGGADAIEQGAATLLELEHKIDSDKMHAPAFRMVVTGVGKYAYRRPQDGTLVVPIACLKD